VQIVGETGDIPGLIDSVDFVIVPSDKAEPFGLIAIEAFARGRAVIGSDAGGLASIVSHGHDGYKFPLGDWQALRDILKNVTKQAAIRMGIEGRQTYTEKYSAKRFASDFGHVWAECLESGGSKL
jgi:glycosyltransferase involved in cell wall biosynthesis